MVMEPVHEIPIPLFWIIAGMMVVTYLPRLLPFYLMRRGRLPSRFQRFLELIPCTALGALILPGIFTSVPGYPVAVVLGIGFAVGWSWFRGGMMMPVVGAILVVYGTMQVAG